MVQLVTFEGPLEADRLAWVASLYGQADAKYRDPQILEHLFVRNPAGASLHAFAFDAGAPVGHCAVVPMRARRGHAELLSGKVEALFVGEAYRGRRGEEEPLVLRLLDRLFAFAGGIDVLHAYVRPEVGRLFRGFDAVRVGEPTLVAVVRPGMLGSTRLRAQGAALAAVQRAVAALVLKSSDASLRPAAAEDLDLADASIPPPERWTVLARDSWDWYRSSPLVQVLELRGGHRALVQLPGSAGDPLRVIGWRPAHPGLRPAVQLLREALRLARARGAATLRFQPWSGAAGNGTLTRACRLLGFVRRSDFTTLYVRARDPVGEVVPTPLLYLGF
jgi:hypothetical protein